MSLTDFMAVQAENAETFRTHPVFASLVSLVDRMYDTAGILASKKHSPTLIRLLMLCRREFLVAESQIVRGLPFDSHANTRRAVEVAKVALAVKKNRANAEEWLKTEVRQRRWDARQQGQKPEYLPSVRFPELDQEPLLASLQQYVGMASDMYIHFTPEFFGRQTFTQTPQSEGSCSWNSHTSRTNGNSFSPPSRSAACMRTSCWCSTRSLRAS